MVKLRLKKLWDAFLLTGCPERAFAWRAFVFALAIRLVFVIATPRLGIGLDDMFQYDMLARSIAAGDGFRWYALADLQHIQRYLSQLQFQIPADYDSRGILTSFRPPLYPAFLALVYLLTGAGDGRFFAARLLQAFLGAALVPLTFLLARSFFPQNERPARVAALVVAIYPILVVYPLALATENLFIPLLLTSLLVLQGAAQSRRARDFLLSGFLLGLTALTRSVILAFAGLAVLWAFFLLRERRNAILMLLMLALTISPWVIRNSLLTGRLSGIETAMGYTLYMGYHPETTGTFRYGPSLDLFPILDDGERDRLGTQKAHEFIRADPWRAAILPVYRLGHFFGLERRGLFYFYSNNFFGYLPPLPLWTLTLLFLLPFVIVSCSAAFGLALARWERTTLLLPLVISGYLAPHLFLLAEERFHYALIPCLAILASLSWTGGLAALRARWRESRTGKVALLLAAVTVLMLLVNWGWEIGRDFDSLRLLFGPTGNRTWFDY